MSTRVLIDCDPGHDDALALVYAARHLEVMAVTTVFGNAAVARVMDAVLALDRTRA